VLPGPSVITPPTVMPVVIPPPPPTIPAAPVDLVHAVIEVGCSMDHGAVQRRGCAGRGAGKADAHCHHGSNEDCTHSSLS
jgi:hypothetical protein